MPAEDLIEPFRAAGTAYIESFAGDAAALIADLNARATADGHPPLRLPPKRVVADDRSAVRSSVAADAEKSA